VIPSNEVDQYVIPYLNDMIWIMKKVVEGIGGTSVSDECIIDSYSKLLGLLLGLVNKVPNQIRAVLNQPFALTVIKWGVKSDNPDNRRIARTLQLESQKNRFGLN
jgi:hypothetical protein